MPTSRFLINTKKKFRRQHSSATTLHRPVQWTSEPGTAPQVASFLTDVEKNPTAYDDFRTKLQKISREEKVQVDEAVEDLLDFNYEFEPEEEQVERLKGGLGGSRRC